MEEEFTCSVACQRLFARCNLRTHYTSSLRTRSLFLALLAVACSFANQAVLPVQFAAAANGPLEAPTTDDQASTSDDGSVSGDRNDEQLGDSHRLAKASSSYQESGSNVDKNLRRWHAPYNPTDVTEFEDFYESHHGAGSDVHERPLDGHTPNTFLRGEPEGAGQRGMPRLDESYTHSHDEAEPVQSAVKAEPGPYDAEGKAWPSESSRVADESGIPPFPAELPGREHSFPAIPSEGPVTHEKIAPGSHTLGGEGGGKKEMEKQRPLTAVEEGNGWLKKEETVVARPGGSVMRRKSHTVLEEGEEQGRSRTGVNSRQASLRSRQASHLSRSRQATQRSRSRQAAVSGRPGDARERGSFRRLIASWENWFRIAGVLAVVLSSALYGSYKFRQRRPQPITEEKK